MRPCYYKAASALHCNSLRCHTPGAADGGAHINIAAEGSHNIARGVQVEHHHLLTAQ